MSKKSLAKNEIELKMQSQDRKRRILAIER
jgi:hypothetical protein